MRVLYIEDDACDAELTRRELARGAPQIELDAVTTLRDARARFAGELVYDLVLVDLSLPDGSGLELVVEIRELALPVAVVVLTGVEAGETAVAALKAGADDYLIKRQDYLTGLPAALEGALKRFSAEGARRARPLRVLYAHDGIADPDIMQTHLAVRAPHIRLALVHGIPAALQGLSGSSAEPCPYDAVVLEHRAGTLEALDALKSLRSDGRLDLPVVLVACTLEHGEVAAQAFRFGAADYLVAHPDHLEALPAVLESVCDRAEVAREQAALRESDSRYRDLVENSLDLICTHDLEGKLLTVNETVSRLTGYSHESLLTMGLRALLTPAARPHFDEYLAELQAHGQARGLMTIVTASGEVRLWEYRNTLRADGVAAPVARASRTTSRSGRERRRRCARARPCSQASSTTPWTASSPRTRNTGSSSTTQPPKRCSAGRRRRSSASRSSACCRPDTPHHTARASSGTARAASARVAWGRR
jgi:PAS domain S-box-containing protein